MSGSSMPHDAVFRRILGAPANAASQLRAVLPAALVERLDLDRLTPVPGSLVDGELRLRHTDLLFTAPLDGREAFVYLLIEHQSSNDPLMAFRMLRYVVRIWDRHLGSCPDATRLPPVIPLVVHHHQRRWTAPTQLLDLIDLDPDRPDAWQSCLPCFQFLLDDLVLVDERALRERPVTHAVRVTLLLLKIAAGNPRLGVDLGAWVDELRGVLAGPDGREEFTALLRYIDLVAEADARDQLHDLIVTLGPEAEEAYMTIADMLRAEGRVEGRAEGRVETLVETLVQLLTFKFGPLPDAVVTTVRGTSADQLQTWIARVLTTDTLDELLR